MSFTRLLKLSIIMLGLALAANAQASQNGIDTMPGSASLPIGVNGATIMNVTSQGLAVGMGQGVPNSVIQANGEVQVGNSNAGCTAANAGAIRYDASQAAIEYCNGQTLSWYGLKNSVVSYEISCETAGTGTSPGACEPAPCADGAVDKGVGDRYMSLYTGGPAGYSSHNTVRSCSITSQTKSLAIYYTSCAWAGDGGLGGCSPEACADHGDIEVGYGCEVQMVAPGGYSGTSAGSCKRACLIQQ